jgi:hypothetical protein
MSKEVETKDPITEGTDDDVEIGHGHLKELEVDVAKVLAENQSFDLDSDHSPYPEGTMLDHSYTFTMNS